MFANFCMQNSGTKRKRASFPELTDSEIEEPQTIIQEAVENIHEERSHQSHHGMPPLPHALVRPPAEPPSALVFPALFCGRRRSRVVSELWRFVRRLLTRQAAGRFVHESSTRAAWNHSSRRLACSDTVKSCLNHRSRREKLYPAAARTALMTSPCSPAR